MFHVSCNCFRFNQVSAAYKKRKAQPTRFTHERNGVVIKIKITQAADGLIESTRIGAVLAAFFRSYLLGVGRGGLVRGCRSVCLGWRFAIKATCLLEFTVVLMEVPTPLCFVGARRKGVASAQRSGLTSEEVRGVCK